MRIPLPFPKCEKCGRTWKQCVHADCKGKLEVNPDNYKVYCNKCRKEWDLWESTYLCVCENEFQAADVKNAVKNMIEISTYAIEEFEKRNHAITSRNDIASSSFKSFLSSFMYKLGSAAGLIVETIIKILFS